MIDFLSEGAGAERRQHIVSRQLKRVHIFQSSSADSKIAASRDWNQLMAVY